MPTIIDNTTSPDRTIVIFDNFYNTRLDINANEYDIVFSFFKFVSDNNDTIAGNFTANLFRISQESEIPVLELLDQIKGLNNKLEMNKVICYFLNSFKSNTALYGVGVIPRPNQLVARNVVQ
jgi:hypothetical protein